MSKGTYTEKLPVGGELKVTANNWYIEIYLPGPDLRYNGDFVRIEGNRVPMCIEALKENWAQYVALTQVVPNGGTLERPGLEGMTIWIGGYWPGVAIKSHHTLVRSAEDLERVTRSYEYAVQKASAVQELLRSLARQAHDEP